MTKTRHRASKIGVVVSDAAHKTATVAVHRRIQHGAYGRIIRRTSTFLVHDENNEARVGDEVEIVETRPLSRRKRWRLARIIARGTHRDEIDTAVEEETA